MITFASMSQKQPTLSPKEVITAIEEYRKFAQTYFEVDLSDMESIKSGNKAIKKMSKIAQRLRLPQHTDKFAELLQESSYHTNVWASRHLLEHMDPDENAVFQAVRVIERYITEQGPKANAESIWLQHWKLQYHYEASNPSQNP